MRGFLPVLLSVFILFFLGFVYSIFNGHDAAIRNYCSRVETFIELNQTPLEKIYTSSFDEVLNCNSKACESEKTHAAMQTLKWSENLHFYGTSYFIRLNSSGYIEKWFLDGETKTTTPTTTRERRVVKLLEGEHSPICTQGWKLDNGFGNMIYLDDRYAEAETIIPVRNGKKIVGAFVSRWGD